MAVETGAGFLQNPSVWVIISTLVFMVVAYKKGRGPILKLLDDRTDKIRKEIEEAERLRVEAQEMLAEYQRKYRDAINTAEEIITTAKERAHQIEQDALDKMQSDLERKEVQLIERIERAEKAAIQDIQNKVADITTSTITTVLEKEISNQDSSLIDNAIKSLPKKISA